jgi:hypothetical protein
MLCESGAPLSDARSWSGCSGFFGEGEGPYEGRPNKARDSFLNDRL